MNFLNKASVLVNKIEKADFNVFQLLFSFLFIVLIRNFLEVFSSVSSFKFIQYYHYILFYISLALSLILLFRLLTNEKLNKIINIILPGFIIIIFPPIIDLLACSQRKCLMTYLLPSDVHTSNLLSRFFLLGGEFSKIGGLTPGIKIELIIVVIASFLYFFLKNKNIIKSALYSLLVYVVIFFI